VAVELGKRLTKCENLVKYKIEAQALHRDLGREI
jgi:hypothetical protein